jgi:2-iminobutanoate/2-iminopropanoate deaminase
LDDVSLPAFPLKTPQCSSILDGNEQTTVMPSSREAVRAPKAARPSGNYSHAVKSGNTIYVSGWMGEDSAGEIVSGDIQAQTVDLDVHVSDRFHWRKQNRAIINIKAVLEAAGTTLDKVMSRRIYLTDMKHLALVDRIWGRHLAFPYPASSCIQVSAYIFQGETLLMEDE